MASVWHAWHLHLQASAWYLGGEMRFGVHARGEMRFGVVKPQMVVGGGFVINKTFGASGNDG